MRRAGMIIYGPAGCGKTTYAAALARHYGFTTVKDDATWPTSPAAWAKLKASGALHLVTDDTPRGATAERSRRVVPFAKAFEEAGLATAAQPPSHEVHHPAHYTQGKVECIDAIEAAMTREEFIGFLRGQVIKYTWRLGRKGVAAVDAEKAQWYGAKLVQVLSCDDTTNQA